jgi:hypothetical protein
MEPPGGLKRARMQHTGFTPRTCLAQKTPGGNKKTGLPLHGRICSNGPG